MTRTDRLRAAYEALTAELYSRMRRLKERQEWRAKHLRPENAAERERRERGE